MGVEVERGCVAAERVEPVIELGAFRKTKYMRPEKTMKRLYVGGRSMRAYKRRIYAHGSEDIGRGIC